MAGDRSIDVPRDRHYERTHHLWARLDEGARHVRVGIDAIGLESLGELAFVSVHPVGATVTQGASMGTLEAAKMTSTIVAPVSGTIVAHNEAVLQDPRIVNADPYERGWIVEIEATSWEAESSALVSGAAIADWVATESARLGAETPAD